MAFGLNICSIPFASRSECATGKRVGREDGGDDIVDKEAGRKR